MAGGLELPEPERTNRFRFSQSEPKSWGGHPLRRLLPFQLRPAGNYFPLAVVVIQPVRPRCFDQKQSTHRDCCPKYLPVQGTTTVVRRFLLHRRQTVPVTQADNARPQPHLVQATMHLHR